MTWLFVPSVSAPASEASTSASASLDPTRAASLSWRGKPQQPQAWSRAWKRGGFIRLLSGLICEPSTLERGAEQWIASCREIPAKETASQESASAPTMTDGCSTVPSRSLIKAGLTPSSARTSRGTSTGSSPSQSLHWSDWAAALRAEYSARPRRKQATGASASSCSPPENWPTPNSEQFGADNPAAWLERREKTKQRLGNGNGFGLTLNMAVHLWPTPAATEPRQGYQRRPDGMASEQNQQSLTTIAIDASTTWETPTAATVNGTRRNRGGARSDELLLSDQAAELSNLCSPPGPATADGPTSSLHGRTLNPLFVEWLMGWPTGLSGFDTAGTASCRSPQPSPGCDCMDCWLSRQREALAQLLAIESPAQGALL